MQATADVGSKRPAVGLMDPPPQLLGDWELVFASNGTVVTRTPLAQKLTALSRLPGVGLEDVQQSLTVQPSGEGLLMPCKLSSSAGFG